LFPLVVGGLTVAKATHALVRSVTSSAVRAIRRLPLAAFWRGEGDLYDPVDGGVTLHCSIPKRIVGEIEQLDFRLLESMGDDYPRRSHSLLTDWYYYVFSKIERPMDRKSCA
jgi:hypothetical protein